MGRVGLCDVRTMSWEGKRQKIGVVRKEDGNRSHEKRREDEDRS